MSEISIKVPMLPESVMSGVISSVLKKVGDTVEIGDVVAELETDKVMLEIPANHAGVVTNCYVEVGQEVKQDEPIIAINQNASVASAQQQVSQQMPEKDESIVKSSPSARLAAENLDININDISGTGKHGTVMKGDVVHSNKTTEKMSSHEPSESAEIVPMSRMRATIAKRLVESKNQTAMLTTFNDVNMDAILSLRNEFKDQFMKVHGVKLGFTSFFVNAVVQSLKEFPIINASVSGSDIIYHKHCNIGVAVSTEKGLVVPVIRNADQLSMHEIEQMVATFAKKAREQKLTIDDLQNGTFTLTNGGVFGSLLSTPIINPPQSAILGMHRIEKRVVVDENDEMKVCSMMYLALSYDHRIIDGRDSVSFLSRVKQYLENPSRILLKI